MQRTEFRSKSTKSYQIAVHQLAISSGAEQIVNDMNEITHGATRNVKHVMSELTSTNLKGSEVTKSMRIQEHILFLMSHQIVFRSSVSCD